MMSIILNKFIMSMICLMASLGATKQGLEFLGLTNHGFEALMIPLAISALLFVMLSFRNRDITGGIVLLLISMSQLTNTVTSLAFDSPGITWQQVFFVIGFGAAAYIYHKRGQGDKYSASVICLTLLFSTLFSDYSDQICGIGYLLCGMMYFMSASQRLYIYCVKKEPTKYLNQHMDETQDEYERMLFGTAGLLCFSILSLFICYYIIDGSESTTLQIVRIVISGVTLVFSLYSIKHGIIDEGVMMLCTSLNMLVFSIAALSGLSEPLIFNVLTSIIDLFLTFKFLQNRKTYVFALISMALFVIFIMEFFFAYAEYMEAVLLLLKILTATVAICSWIEYETGNSPIQFISKITEKYSFTPEHLVHGRDLTPLVTSGILLLWLGSNHILNSLELHVDEEIFSIVGLLLSILPLAYVKNLFLECRVSEGMLIFTICISTLTMSLTEIFYGEVLPDITFSVFSMVAMICFIMFVRHRNIPMCCASLALLFSFMVNTITGDMFRLSSGILYVIAGSFMMYDTFLVMFLGERWEIRLFRIRPDISNNTDPLFAIVPFFMYLSSLTCLLFTFEEPNTGFCILNIILAVVALIASFNCMVRGDAYSFPFVLMISVIAITDSFSFILGAEDSYFIYTPIILIGLLSAPSYLKNGRFLLGMGSMTCGILMLIGSLINVWMFVWIGFGILGVISFLYAINMWFDNDFGWCPIKALRFGDLYDRELHPASYSDWLPL